MTLAELRTLIRFKTNVKSTTDLTNAELDTLINNAQDHYFSMIVGFNDDFYEQQKAKFNLIALSSKYRQPSSCVKIKQVRLAYSTPASEGDYAVAEFYDPASVDNIEMQELHMTTTCPVVDVTGDCFRIFPKPDTSVSNGGELYFIERPAPMTLSADVSVIPLQHHEVLALKAGSDVAQRFGMYDKWTVFQKELLQKEERLFKDLTPRELNRPFRFRSALEVNNRTPKTELWG